MIEEYQFEIGQTVVNAVDDVIGVITTRTRLTVKDTTRNYYIIEWMDNVERNQFVVGGTTIKRWTREDDVSIYVRNWNMYVEDCSGQTFI